MSNTTSDTTSKSQATMYTRTVRLKVATDMMDDRTRRRLDQLMQRDSSIIDRIIGIITQEEGVLLRTRKHGPPRIHRSRLHKLIYSTDSRKAKYDLKQEFAIDANSLIECRRSAVWMYNSYLALNEKPVHTSSRPQVNGLVPRSINQRRFEITKRDGTYWIGSIDSLDGADGGRYPRLYLPVVMYDYAKQQLDKGTPVEMQIVRTASQWYIHLRVRYEVTASKHAVDRELAMVGIDLGISKMMVCSVLTRRGVIESKVFHNQQQLQKWRQKEQERKHLIELIKQRQDLKQRIQTISRFKSTIGSIRQLMPRDIEYSDPYRDFMASLSHLGSIIDQIQAEDIASTAEETTRCITTVSLVRHQLREFLTVIQVWEHEKNRSLDPLTTKINQLEEIICTIEAIIGSGIDTTISTSTRGLQRRLNATRHDVHNIKLDMDRQVVVKLVKYLEQLKESYHIYLFVGDLRDIVYEGGNSQLAKRLKRWSYGRITDMIEEKTYELGLYRRFFRVHEYYTSAKCHRCRKIGVRPKQSVFFCSYEHCAWRGNADINGSINIAKQGIYYLKMREEFANSRIAEWLAPPSR